MTDALRLELSLANLRAKLAGEAPRKFSDDQPRDDHGRWTDGAGDSVVYGSGGTTPQRGDAVTLQDGRAAVVNGPAGQEGRVSVIVDGSRRGSTAAIDSLSPRSEPAPGDAGWYGGIEPVSYASTGAPADAVATNTPTDAADINTLESDPGLAHPWDYLVDPNDPEGETGLDVLNWYAGSYAINQDIREGSITGEDADRMHQLDAMIAASSTTQAYVGMRGTQLDSELAGLTPEQMVGKTYTEPGFVSTASPTAAGGYSATTYLYPEGTNLEGTTTGPPVLARVLMPDGTHVTIDTQEGESEAILPRGTTFTITDAQTREDIAGVGSYTYLEVTADTSQAPGVKSFVPLAKYADDQPRDDHGRFADGGGIPTSALDQMTIPSGQMARGLVVEPPDRAFAERAIAHQLSVSDLVSAVHGDPGSYWYSGNQGFGLGDVAEHAGNGEETVQKYRDDGSWNDGIYGELSTIFVADELPADNTSVDPLMGQDVYRPGQANITDAYYSTDGQTWTRASGGSKSAKFDDSQPRDSNGRWVGEGTATEVESGFGMQRGTQWDFDPRDTAREQQALRENPAAQENRAEFPSGTRVVAVGSRSDPEESRRGTVDKTHPDGSADGGSVGVDWDGYGTFIGQVNPNAIVREDEWEQYRAVTGKRFEFIETPDGLFFFEKYGDDQPRDDHGRWTSGGGDSSATGPDPLASHNALYGEHAGTPTDPVPCGSDIERAAKIIADGGNVTLNQPQEIATLLDKMQELVQEAEAKGEKAPTFDLCDVSVPGTNLFCQDHVVDDQGNPLDRIQMPQLATTDPVPGSLADQQPRNQFGEVDLSSQFAEFLAQTGRPPVEETVDAATLRASQDQLNGAKVAGIVDAIENGTYDVTTGRIWVTSDNYVIDGHHRWAAAVAESYSSGTPVELPIRRLDMDIGTALTTANYWTEENGIQGRSLTAKAVGFALDVLEAFGFSLKYAPDQIRDENGRWTAGGALDVHADAKPLKGQDHPRALPAFGLSEKATQAVYDKLNSVGVTHEELVNELKSRIGDDPAFLEQASKWYEEAHADAQGMADRSDGKISLEQAQAVIAAISPRTQWEGNVNAANAVVDYYLNGDGSTLSAEEDPPGSGRYAVVDGMKEQLIADTGHSVSGFNDNLAKAFQILQGDPIDDTLSGLKVRSFYNNIDDPGGTRDVTIDGHMNKIIGAVSDLTDSQAGTLLGQKSAAAGQQYAGAGYIGISEAVRAVSTEWGVPPDTVQAAYWLKVQKIDYADMKTTATP